MARLLDSKEHARAAYGSARASAQRVAIAEAVDALADRAFSAEDLAAAVRVGSPGIGLATIYRAIAVMESTGFVEPVGERSGAVLYARCGSDGHHHHLMCTSCGTVANAECPLLVDAGEDSRGFQVTGHSLVLYGLCPSCQLKGA